VKIGQTPVCLARLPLRAYHLGVWYEKSILCDSVVTQARICWASGVGGEERAVLTLNFAEICAES
jgi:hypothetical protein